MSTHTFKPGDRVRVVTDVYLPYIRPDDKGTVRSGPDLVAGGAWSYIVALDRDPAAGIGHVFIAEHIEPTGEAAPRRRGVPAMSTHALQPGDRVRVTAHYHGKVYQPGDKGTVSWVARTAPGLAPVHYHVTMDKNGPAGTSVLFAEDEIESDV
jgi:hypothetical protein